MEHALYRIVCFTIFTKTPTVKYIFTLLITIAFVSFGISQDLKYCGSDEMSFDLYQSEPGLQTKMKLNRAELNLFTQQYMANISKNRGVADSLYTIPVVFHIIHTYGAENITDEQVMSGLKVLNWNFRKQNPDTALIVAAFKPIAADCEIQFKLAHIDPNGNCTNGINRIASLSSIVGDHRVKDRIHWDPTKYLNVYVVKQIANLAGHCLMPDQADAKPEWDGIVIANDYVGDMGTSNKLRSVVMAHESGHYLNLFHIWGGNNVPDYYYLPVGQTTNCSIGDSVSDTPPTKGWSSCNLSAASCGNVVDNVQNAMDYSYCNFMFTQGQRNRMRAALHSPIAGRNNLITPQNLLATGVNDSTLCKAKFEISQRTVCVGDSVRFTDKSLWYPTSWTWDFGDGSYSSDQNPAHVYAAGGDYFVSLTVVQNATTLHSDTMMVRVNGEGTYPFYVQHFDSLPNFGLSYLWNISDNNNLLWKLSDNGQGYNSGISATIRPDDSTDAYSGRTILYSPAINLAGRVNPEFNFKYAFTPKITNNYDQLEVFVSKTCGATWQSLGKKIGGNLASIAAPVDDKNWTPADSTQWKTFSYIVPANLAVPNFQFKIEFTNYRGNVLYIDNININSAEYTHVEDLHLNEVILYPNPATNTFSVEGEFEQLLMTITDLNGKVVSTSKEIHSGEQHDISTLPQGVYIVSLQSHTTVVHKRLLK